jgi:hypothetical protein
MREVARNQPAHVEGVTRQIDIGYLFSDVEYPGKVTLIDKDAMPDKTPFLQICDEIVEMHNKKQADYGRVGDPFANVRASADFGVPAWVGCMIRANDKMRRIQTAAQGSTLKNEGVEDSLLDLAVYAIIGLVLYREDHS